MLFLKIFDQGEDGWEDDARDQGRPYRSAIPEARHRRNWAAYVHGEPQIPASPHKAFATASAPDLWPDAGKIISTRDVLGHLQGIVHVDAKVAHRTLDPALPAGSGPRSSEVRGDAREA